VSITDSKKESKRVLAMTATTAAYSNYRLELLEPLTTQIIQPPSAKKSKIETEQDTMRRIFEKTKFPIEDQQYWSMIQKMGGLKPGLPVSTLRKQRELSGSPCLLGKLLSAWLVINNFRSLLDLPFISLEALEDVLEDSSNPNPNVLRDSSNPDLCVNPGTYSIASTHPLIREISVNMLTLLLLDRDREKEKEKEKEKEFTGLSVLKIKTMLSEGEYRDGEDNMLSTFVPWDRDRDLIELSKRGREGRERKDGKEGREEKDGLKKGLKEEKEKKEGSKDMLQANLRVGDAWVETLRVLMAAKVMD
jgi:hypothetical protein